MKSRNVFATAMLSIVSALACHETPVTARPQVDGGIAEQGPALMKEYGCITCHVIPGVGAANGAVGPPLTNFGDRTFIAGRLRNEPENLVLWIMHPQRVRPGTAMPELGVTDSAARHIAAYLYTLSSNRGGPPFVMPPKTRPGH